METTSGLLRQALSLAVVSRQRLEIPGMLNWVPIIFLVFKLAVFGTGMFFAIKWHYDQDKKKKNKTAPNSTPEGSR